MRYHGLVEAEFEAGHYLPGDARCGLREHGHRYLVQVKVAGRMQREGLSVDLDLLRSDWTAIIREFDGRPLQDMMPGVSTTPFGIARYLLERMLGSWPSVQEVTVWERPGVGATVSQEET